MKKLTKMEKREECRVGTVGGWLVGGGVVGTWRLPVVVVQLRDLIIVGEFLEGE